MAKETFSPEYRLRNTFLAMMVAGAMNGPIKNLPHQIEEGPFPPDAKTTPVHTLYFPQVNNGKEVNTLAPSPELPTPEVTPGAEVIVSSLNVRSGPGISWPAVDGLARGTSVEVVERYNNGWLRIRWQEEGKGQEGWISGKSAYVDVNEKVEEIPLSAAENPLPTVIPNPVPTAAPTPTAVPQETLAERAEEVQSPEAEVEVRRPAFWGDRSQSEVALTFDDGFSAQAIQTTLEVLRANNIQGTFFVIGSQLKAYPDLWRQAVVDGHQICNHTYTHTYLSSLSGEEIKKELARWEAAAAEVLGEEYVRRMKQEFAYVRFPGGAGHNSDGVLEAVAEAGYRPIVWSQETYAAVLKNHNLKNEAVAPIADEVRQHTVNAAQNGSIILLHFNSWDTLYLGQTVRGLIDKGLTPTSVSRVLD